jgi:hypothetical protein
MAGSNIVAVKRRLMAVVPGLLGIVGDYSLVGKRLDAEREYFCLGGRAQGPMMASAMAGGGRYARDEELEFSAQLGVRQPGQETVETVEARTVELGTLFEEWLAGNWTLGADIPGLLKVQINAFELESGVDDDGASATLTYTLLANSHIR